MKKSIILVLLSFIFVTFNCNEFTEDIYLPYGIRQEFQFRHNDINILGYFNAPVPVQKSVYHLNQGSEVLFYVRSTISIKDSISRPISCLLVINNIVNQG